MRSAVCKYCQVPFEYTNKGKIRRFCSPACYHASMLGKDHGGSVTHNCEACGNSFTVKRFYFNRVDGKTRQRFCSRACATLAINDAHKKFELRNCLTCGKSIYPKLNKGKLTEFCSRHCFGISGRAVHAIIAIQDAKQPTSIERLMRDALDRAGIIYEFQYPIYNSAGLKLYACDFAIPSARLIIECDGNYWHAQPKVIASDKRKDGYLKSHGYNVLRFTETEIKQDVNRCVQVVLQSLS